MEPSLVDGGASPLRTGAVVCLAQVVDGVTYRLRSSRCCQLGCSFAPARDGFREDFQFRVVAARATARPSPTAEVLLVSRGKFRLSAEAVGLPAAASRARPCCAPGRAAAALDGTRLALVPPAPRAASASARQALALFHEEHAQFLSADPRGPLRALRRTFLGGAEPCGDYGRPLLPAWKSTAGSGRPDQTLKLPTAADLRRMYMQLFFNFVVALLLLNMVAGIIIDTFSQLSQESLEASKIKMNECFTTGLHRSQFETLKEVDFDLDHKPRCAMLNYVHFIGYVMHKDCVNDSPLERAVRDKLRDGDAS
ncbi:hypothetical protein JL720_4014 [Aureococcus anophagefferens]|nr:hypothetical protein JL720_4014 [Aureococcus anophagefferens]